MVMVRLNGTLVDQNEAVVVGALVYVYDQPGGLADLEDASEEALANPVTTDEQGYWEAYVETERYYTIKYYWGGRLRLTDSNVLAGDPPVGPNSDPNLRIDLADDDEAKGSALVAFMPEGVGSVARTAQAKLREVVSVKDFGAVGDYDPDTDAGTDDTAAIQAAIDYCKGLGYVQAEGITPSIPYMMKAGALLFPPGLYLVTETLFFGVEDSHLDTTGVVGAVIGDGAVIIGQTDGDPVIDLSGAFTTTWTGISIFANATASPNVGILLSREGNEPGNNPSAGAHRFTNINVHGDFTLACVYNNASEINWWSGCYFFQASGKFVYVNTSDNARYAVTSPHVDIAQHYQSAYGDFFTGCFFKNSTINALAEAVILLESLDFGPSFYNNYIDTSGAAYTANILFRTGASIAVDAAAAISQGVRIVGNTFEYRAEADIVALYEDAKVIGLEFTGNTAPANTDGGRAHFALGVDSYLENLDAQKFAGDTNGGPVIITKASGARVVSEEYCFIPMDPALIGAGWTFLEGELTRDGSYHTIDLNDLFEVPTTAKFAQVRVMAQTSAAANANDFVLRGDADADDALNFRVCPPVSNISVFAEGLVPVVNGVIEYKAAANFAIARILFRGVFV